MAYDTFWQAYSGLIDTDSLSDYGWWARSFPPALGPLVLAGLATRDYASTTTVRGFDRYHDLERG